MDWQSDDDGNLSDDFLSVQSAEVLNEHEFNPEVIESHNNDLVRRAEEAESARSNPNSPAATSPTKHSEDFVNYLRESNTGSSSNTSKQTNGEPSKRSNRTSGRSNSTKSAGNRLRKVVKKKKISHHGPPAINIGRVSVLKYNKDEWKRVPLPAGTYVKNHQDALVMLAGWVRDFEKRNMDDMEYVRSHLQTLDMKTSQNKQGVERLQVQHEQFQAKMEAKLELLEDSMQKQIDSLTAELKKSVSKINHDFDEELEAAGERFNKLEERTELTENTLTKYAPKVDTLVETVDSHGKRHHELSTKVSSINQKVDKARNTLDRWEMKMGGGDDNFIVKTVQKSTARAKEDLKIYVDDRLRNIKLATGGSVSADLEGVDALSLAGGQVSGALKDQLDGIRVVAQQGVNLAEQNQKALDQYKDKQSLVAVDMRRRIKDSTADAVHDMLQKIKSTESSVKHVEEMVMESQAVIADKLRETGELYAEIMRARKYDQIERSGVNVAQLHNLQSRLEVEENDRIAQTTAITHALGEVMTVVNEISGDLKKKANRQDVNSMAARLRNVGEKLEVQMEVQQIEKQAKEEAMVNFKRVDSARSMMAAQQKMMRSQTAYSPRRGLSARRGGFRTSHSGRGLTFANTYEDDIEVDNYVQVISKDRPHSARPLSARSFPYFMDTDDSELSDDGENQHHQQQKTPQKPARAQTAQPGGRSNKVERRVEWAGSRVNNKSTTGPDGKPRRPVTAHPSGSQRKRVASGSGSGSSSNGANGVQHHHHNTVQEVQSPTFSNGWTKADTGPKKQRPQTAIVRQKENKRVEVMMPSNDESEALQFRSQSAMAVMSRDELEGNQSHHDNGFSGMLGFEDEITQDDVSGDEDDEDEFERQIERAEREAKNGKRNSGVSKMKSRSRGTAKRKKSRESSYVQSDMDSPRSFVSSSTVSTSASTGKPTKTSDEVMFLDRFGRSSPAKLWGEFSAGGDVGSGLMITGQRSAKTRRG